MNIKQVSHPFLRVQNKQERIYPVVNVNTAAPLNKKPSQIDRVYAVRKKGLEPPRLAAPDPKSGAATNYATSALGFLRAAKIII